MSEPMYPSFATKGQAEGRAEDKEEVVVAAPIARSGRLISLVKDLPNRKLPIKVMAQDVDPRTELDLEERSTESSVRPRRLETIFRSLFT